VKFHFKQHAVSQAWTNHEAHAIVGPYRASDQEDLFKPIGNANSPTWKMQVPLMPGPESASIG